MSDFSDEVKRVQKQFDEADEKKKDQLGQMQPLHLTKMLMIRQRRSLGE